MEITDSQPIIKSEYIEFKESKCFLPSSQIAEELKIQEQARRRLRLKALYNEGEKIKTAHVHLETLMNEIDVAREQANEERKIILENAEKEKEKIIAEGVKEKEKIIEGAQKEKQRIIGEGNASKNDILEEARQAGYKDGFDKGYIEGEKERETAINRLKSILDNAYDTKNSIIDSSRKYILKVIMGIVRKIVFHESGVKKDLILETIENSLKEIKGKEKILIRIHPDDLDISRENIERFTAQVRGLSDIELKSDSGITRGGCLIETDFGKIDARIESQCDMLERRLSNIQMTEE